MCVGYALISLRESEIIPSILPAPAQIELSVTRGAAIQRAKAEFQARELRRLLGCLAESGTTDVTFDSSHLALGRVNPASGVIDNLFLTGPLGEAGRADTTIDLNQPPLTGELEKILEAVAALVKS